ncbi:MAG: hypothetical protein GX810_05655 [Clostridiales bacterium]|nr:hypothetical protein [Clostridiales bacterium]
MKTNSKRAVLIALLVAVAVVLTACQANTPTTTATTAPAATTAQTAEPVSAPAEAPVGTTDAEIPDKTFTLEELAQFDGQEGRAAYVAVDGVVYDVTNVPAWKGGLHAGGSIRAGGDMTVTIKRAPNGPENLEAAVVVGRMAE